MKLSRQSIRAGVPTVYNTSVEERPLGTVPSAWRWKLGKTLALSVASIALVSAVGCSRSSEKHDLAPVASALASAKPVTQKAVHLTVQQASSEAGFLMDAPMEKIHGMAKKALVGDIYVDPADLGKTRGLIKVDLDKLELFQQKRAKKGEKFGERVKNPTQNKHARTWLEISEDAPADVRAKNRWIEFKLTGVKGAAGVDLSQFKGVSKSMTVTVTGDMRLHGRKSVKKATLKLVFEFDKGRVKTVKVSTDKPFSVGLAEHDVRPRKAFGKLAQKTLDLLSPKVAKVAQVSLAFTATSK